jgi:hypothetical protein
MCRPRSTSSGQALRDSSTNLILTRHFRAGLKSLRENFVLYRHDFSRAVNARKNRGLKSLRENSTYKLSPEGTAESSPGR